MNTSSSSDAWLSDLTPENFLAVYDLVLDIRSELQLAQIPRVPILPPVIRFPQLMPADSIPLRDRYCGLRWKAAQLLKEKGVINSIETLKRGHRWQSVLELKVDRERCLSLAEVMNQEYKTRSGPAEPAAQQEDEQHSGSALELPERVTLSWLVRHVPVGVWISFAALVFASFAAGAKAGHTSLGRELLGEPQSALPTLTQNELRERVDKLVEGLNANTARITAGVVDEEQSAGRTTFSADRQSHVEAAQRLRDLLKQEHERFQSSLAALSDVAIR